MTVPRGTLFIIIPLIFIIVPNISPAKNDSNFTVLSESANISSGIFSTKSLTSPSFSCNIYLTLSKEINMSINYCNNNEWQLTLGLKNFPSPNLIATSQETIVCDPKENKMYQGNIGNKIKFSIGLFPLSDGYRLTHTIGFENEQDFPDIDIDLSSIIKASIKRDKITFTDEKGLLVADGIHEQNNILSKTKIWVDKKSKLPVKIELSMRPSSSPENSWRRLVLFENISTDCSFKHSQESDYKNYAKQKKVMIESVEEKEIMMIFLKVMKDLGLSN